MLAGDGWAEPGGDADPFNPQLEIPAFVQKVPEWTRHDVDGLAGTVSDEEIDWMMQQRPLILSKAQLEHDYGSTEAAEILRALEDARIPEAAAGAVAWPGVGTRWRRFVRWWRSLPQDHLPATAREALAAFARAVGRVRTYRALALDDIGLQNILEADEIFPSGRLRPGVDEAFLRGVVEEHGVTKVAVIRLYIANIGKLGGIDPSISLHDDWQTTSVIASGYATGAKRVHLFELDVPAVESLGWTLFEVAHRAPAVLGARYSDHGRWFCFKSPAEPEGTWFDATLQRTERYGLYSVPHLRRRLRSLHVFQDIGQIGRAVQPFSQEMQRRQEAEPDSP